MSQNKLSRKKAKRKILAALVRVSLAFAIAIAIFQIRLDYLEAWSYDFRVRTKPTSPTSGMVATVAIDSDTIERFKRRPTARDHVRFLEKLAQHRPRAIIYVIDPTKIEGTLKDLSVFAKTTKLVPFYVGSSSLPVKGLEENIELEPPLENLKVLPAPATSDRKSFSRDGVTRRMVLDFQGNETLYTVLARPITGLYPEGYRGSFFYFDSNQLYVDFRPKGTYQPISFAEIATKPPSELNQSLTDKFVLVGSDALMASDDYIMTPHSRSLVAMSKLEMHANMMDTLLLNSAPVESPKWLDLVFTILISILTVFVVLTLRPTRGLAILAGTIVIFSLLAYGAMSLFQFKLNMAHPFLAVFVCYYFFIPYRLIIENRRSWEYYQKNKLLTEVEELKSNFLKMMSHDLKTPLARIQGMAEVVMSRADSLSEQQVSALKTIDKSSEELNEFIGSILNLGRIESKEIKLHLKGRDINSLLDRVIKKHEYLAREKNIEIISEFEPMFSVKVDEELLQQVFSNLIENAIKYSPDNSKILVTSEEVDGRVVVQVADQGIGIPEEELSNVFSKFYRSQGVTNTSIKGSGLGLYLSQYFVKLHNGNISVESSVGQGSTFTVELPTNLELNV